MSAVRRIALSASGLLCLLVAGASGQVITDATPLWAPWTRYGNAVRKAPTIVKFDAETYKGKTGRILVPFTGPCTLYVVQGGGAGSAKIVRMPGCDGTIVCPAGTFTLNSLTASILDAERHEVWRLSFQFAKFVARLTVGGRVANVASGWQRLAMGAGSVYELDIGPPYTASVTVEQIEVRGQKKVQMLLSIKDHNGSPVTITAGSSVPGFQVVSKQGEVLMRGKFQYG